MYGLPHAEIIAQELLKKRLLKAGCKQRKITPGYWTYQWQLIRFLLVVDDFGIKYIGKEHVQHLINTLKQNYDIEEDWDGNQCLSITLNWDYKNHQVHLSMPSYVGEQHIETSLQRGEKAHPTSNWNFSAHSIKFNCINTS
jgi:hypothetical protein